MPEKLSPKPSKVILVIGVTGDGTVRHVIFAPATPAFHQVTGVREHDGWLYLGSLVSGAIADSGRRLLRLENNFPGRQAGAQVAVRLGRLGQRIGRAG